MFLKTSEVIQIVIICLGCLGAGALVGSISQLFKDDDSGDNVLSHLCLAEALYKAI